MKNNICYHNVSPNVPIDLHPIIEGSHKLLANQRLLYKTGDRTFFRDGGHWMMILTNSDEVHA